MGWMSRKCARLLPDYPQQLEYLFEDAAAQRANPLQGQGQHTGQVA